MLQGLIFLRSFSITFWHILGGISECWLLSAQELKVFLHKYGLLRSPTKKKKSNGVKAHDVGGQLISPRQEITRPGNVSCNNVIFVRVMWHVPPSCWNHIFFKSHFSIAGKKVCYHMIITLRIDGDSFSIDVFEKVSSNHTFGPKSARNSDFFWL